MKRVVFVVVGLAFALSALAELSKYKDWDRSPDAYFLTPAERAEWKTVATDEQAEKFIALYWAKRGGEPFKQEVSRRIAAADQQFKLARYKRGADSVRGRLLVTLGPPSRVSQQRAQEGAVDDTGGVTAPGIDTRFQGDAAQAAILYTWTWDKDKLPEVLGISELKAQISVDPRVGTDELRNGAQAEKAIATAGGEIDRQPERDADRRGSGRGRPRLRRQPPLRPLAPAPRGRLRRPWRLRRSCRFRPRSRRPSRRHRPRWPAKRASGRARSVRWRATTSSPCSSTFRPTRRPSPRRRP